MTGTFALIGVLIGLILRANKEFGKIESKKLNYAHIALMVFAVLITSLSMGILFKLVLQFEATMQIMYVENGFFSPTLNTMVWLLSTTLNVIVLFSIMSVALRSEIARKILVSILPFLLVFSIIKSVNEVIALSNPEDSIGLPIAIVIVGMFLSFAPLFFFYRNQNVKKTIFDSAIREEHPDNV